MKKSRLLIALLLMLVVASGYAQDSYREAVKQYIAVNGQADQMKSAFMTLNETLFKKTDGVDLNALTERYIKECLNDQLTDMALPMMKQRNLTEADLKTVTALLSTPEGQAYTAHQSEWNKEIPVALFGAIIEQADVLEDSVATEAAQDVAVNPEIDAAYQAKFKKMMKDAKIKDMIMDFWDGFQEGAPNLPDSFKKWFEKNFVAIALNSAYGIMTLEDLDYATKLYANEAYVKTQNMSGLKLKDLQSTGMDMIGRYVDWMQAQGAQLSGTANLMKSLLEKKDEIE